jgi:putative acetyltransferase
MSAILDIADNWLKLKRVELSVFTDNEPAIALYKIMGFAVEGTKKYSAVRNGAHIDEFLMARYGE